MKIRHGSLMVGDVVDGCEVTYVSAPRGGLTVVYRLGDDEEKPLRVGAIEALIEVDPLVGVPLRLAAVAAQADRVKDAMEDLRQSLIEAAEAGRG